MTTLPRYLQIYHPSVDSHNVILGPRNVTLTPPSSALPPLSISTIPHLSTFIYHLYPTLSQVFKGVANAFPALNGLVMAEVVAGRDSAAVKVTPLPSPPYMSPFI